MERGTSGIDYRDWIGLSVGCVLLPGDKYFSIHWKATLPMVPGASPSNFTHASKA